MIIDISRHQLSFWTCSSSKVRSKVLIQNRTKRQIRKQKLSCWSLPFQRTILEPFKIWSHSRSAVPLFLFGSCHQGYQKIANILLALQKRCPPVSYWELRLETVRNFWGRPRVWIASSEYSTKTRQSQSASTSSMTTRRSTHYDDHTNIRLWMYDDERTTVSTSITQNHSKLFLSDGKHTFRTLSIQPLSARLLRYKLEESSLSSSFSVSQHLALRRLVFPNVSTLMPRLKQTDPFDCFRKPSYHKILMRLYGFEEHFFRQHQPCRT